MFKKKLQAEHMGKSSLWELPQRKAGSQKKPWFHLAAWKMFPPVAGRRKRCVMTAGMFTLCQTKQLLTENKQVKGYLYKSHPGKLWGKKSSKWSNKSPQIENALFGFSN